jgi:YesN/AraC family two-component response regulator
MSPNNKTANEQDILRVLIADDEPEMRRGTRLMMSMVPNARVVAIAQNGREAFALTKQHQPDVALMDINMPGMDGLDAIRAMRRLRHQPLCIIISAEKDAPTVKKAVQIGVVAYLVKPFTVEELSAVIEKTRKIVLRDRARKIKHAEQRRRQLEEMAEVHVKARRTDEKTIAVLEALSAYPDCSMRWLMSLAMIYVMRQNWHKLKLLAGYLEQRKG